jgi:formate hydrogenlyase subunit 3/multisubunit Na+/H+ antiporter MnhD subunit
VGYVTLVDWGAGLISLGLGTRAGVETMVQMLVWRAFSLLLVGVGWGALYTAGRRDDLEHCAEPVRRHPLAVIALVLGLLSLAGFPLAPGGFGRRMLLDRALLSQPLADWPAPSLVLVLAGAAASVGIVAAVSGCLKTTDDGRRTKDDGRQTTDDERHINGDAHETDEQEPAEKRAPEERARAQEERRARRRRTVGALLGSGVSLLALWLIGAVLTSPAPWIELARRLVGRVAFPGG